MSVQPHILSLTTASSRCVGEAEGQTMPFHRTTAQFGRAVTSGGHPVQSPTKAGLPLLTAAKVSNSSTSSWFRNFLG